MSDRSSAGISSATATHIRASFRRPTTRCLPWADLHDDANLDGRGEPAALDTAHDVAASGATRADYNPGIRAGRVRALRVATRLATHVRLRRGVPRVHRGAAGRG